MFFFLIFRKDQIMTISCKRADWEPNCLGGNTEKYKTFSVSITEEFKRIGKSGKEITKTKSITYMNT